MRDLLRLSVPLTLWLALFSLIYGLHATLCATGVEGALARAMLAAVWGIGVALQLGMLLALRSPRFGALSPTIRQASVALAATALFATVWSLFPALILPLC